MRDFLAEHVGPGVVILRFRPPRKRKSIQVPGSVLYVDRTNVYFAPQVGGVLKLPVRKIIEAWAFPERMEDINHHTWHNAFILWSLVRKGGWPYFKRPTLEFEIEKGVHIRLLPLVEEFKKRVKLDAEEVEK